MKSKERQILEELNQQDYNLKEEENKYSRFDAYNDKYIVEIKNRTEVYEDTIIEFDKYAYNLTYSKQKNKVFLYVVKMDHKIYIFNITDLDKENYSFKWEWRSLPKQTEFKTKPKKEKAKPKVEKPVEKIVIEQKQNEIKDVDIIENKPLSQIKTLDADDLDARKSKYLEQAEEQEVVRKHRSLQYYVRSMAQQRGFKSTIEESTLNGGKVDVSLLKNDIRIAIEISVTNRVNYEVQNIQKCLDDNYSLVYMISENEKHLKNIKEQTFKTISKNQHSKIHFFASEELHLYLDALQQPKTKVKRVRGYKVKVEYKTDNDISKLSSITNIIMKALRKGE